LKTKGNGALMPGGHHFVGFWTLRVWAVRFVSRGVGVVRLIR